MNHLFTQEMLHIMPAIEPVHLIWECIFRFPVAQLVEHGTSNAKIMGLIPRESKSW